MALITPRRTAAASAGSPCGAPRLPWPGDEDARRDIITTLICPSRTAASSTRNSKRAFHLSVSANGTDSVRAATLALPGHSSDTVQKRAASAADSPAERLAKFCASSTVTDSVVGGLTRERGLAVLLLTLRELALAPACSALKAYSSSAAAMLRSSK